MRRLVLIAVSVVFCAAAFLCTAAWSLEEMPAAGTTAAKATKMSAAGVVTELSETLLKIERKVKDKVEVMEFVLEKPLAKIKVGDKVKVSYVTTAENQNLATKVSKYIPQKAIKKMKVEGKPAQGIMPAGR